MDYTSLALSIVLLIIGSAATLSAFGGETWTKADAPIIKRITIRGWVSLLCLVSALVLGILKELHTNTVADDQARRAGQSAQLAKEREEDLRDRVKVVTQQLSSATKALADQKAVVDKIDKVENQVRAQVASGNEGIGLANKNLSKSSELLDRLGTMQTEIKDLGAWSALALGGKVKQLHVKIPIKAKSQTPSVLESLFPDWRTLGRRGMDDELLLMSVDARGNSTILSAGGLSLELDYSRARPNKPRTTGQVSVENIHNGEYIRGMVGAPFVANGVSFSLLIDFDFFTEVRLRDCMTVLTRGTPFLTIQLILRPDVSSSEVKNQIDSSDRLFPRTGMLELPVSDQPSVSLQYDLSRDAVLQTSNGNFTNIPTEIGPQLGRLVSGPLPIVIPIVYSITSAPSFHSGLIEDRRTFER